jgi:hypothetical protein
MKKNMSNSDKTIRVLVALIIAGFYFLHIISGTLAIVLLAVAAIFIINSFVGFCPLYGIFGLSTRSKKEAQKI